MDSVIAGIEDTEESRGALRFARLLAGDDSNLTIASVYAYGYYMAPIGEIQEAREDYFQRMREIAAEEAGSDWDFKEFVGLSAPAGITRAAEEADADMIVIGSSHRGPIGRVLMGDAGARLAAGAPCAVAVTPRGWDRKSAGRIERIGVAVDGSSESAGAIAFASVLADQFDAEIRMIGVVPYVMAPTGTGMGIAGPEVQQTIKDELDTWMKTANELVGPSRIQPEIFVGDAADEIAEASQDVDLMVMGSRGYGPLRRVLLGGTSLKVMRSAACPVIVVPRSGESEDSAS